MTIQLIDTHVDMYQLPAVDNTPGNYAEIGDLHANPIRFLYFLFRQDIIHFKDNVENPELRYQDFIKLYEDFETLINRHSKLKKELALTTHLIEVNQTRIKKELDGENRDSELEKLQNQKIQISADYRNQTQELVEIEQAIAALQLMDRLQGFLNDLIADDNPKAVKLIGDELADRGANDVFIIEILKFLRQSNVPFSILASNHGNEFVTAYENLLTIQQFLPANDVGDHQKPSFVGLGYLLEKGIISQDYLIDFVEKTYKPALRLYEYGLDEDGITIYSHAPIEFALQNDNENSINSIQLTAQQFGIEYRDGTPIELALTLEKINEAFAAHKDKNQVHKLTHVSIDTGFDPAKLPKSEVQNYPVAYTVWNRFNAEKDTIESRPAVRNGYKVRYVHGHDNYQSQFEHVFNLDTSLGKSSRLDENVQKILLEAMDVLRDQQADPDLRQKASAMLNDHCRYKVTISSEKKLTPRQVSSVMEIEDTIAELKRKQKAIGAAAEQSPLKSMIPQFFGKKPSISEMSNLSEKIATEENNRMQEMERIQSNFGSKRANKAIVAIQSQMTFISKLTANSNTEMNILNGLLINSKGDRTFFGQICQRIEREILSELITYLKNNVPNVADRMEFKDKYQDLSAQYYKKGINIDELNTKMHLLAEEIVSKEHLSTPSLRN